MHTPSPAGNPTTASQQKGDSADVGNVIKPHSAPAGDARTSEPEPTEAAMQFAMQEYGATSLDDCFDYEISRLRRWARVFDDFAARAVEAAVAKERARCTRIAKIHNTEHGGLASVVRAIESGRDAP